MQNELTVPSEAAARALARSYTFLGHFRMPQSPSEVAARMGLAANLVHHHARRLAGLGLLQKERGRAGRVYYQLTARQFRVPVNLLPPGDPDENAVRALRSLSTEFLNANARSWSHGGTKEAAVYGFGVGGDESQVDWPPGNGSNEPYPAHLDTLSLRLTPERYRALALALSALLNEAAGEPQGSSGQVCTLTVLGFQDHRQDVQDGQSTVRTTSSFLPWPVRGGVPGDS